MGENTLLAEMDAVKKLGEQIGYGNLIGWASALWREQLRNSGFPERGAFVGVCQTSVKDNRLEDVLKQEAVYDSWVQRLKGE